METERIIEMIKTIASENYMLDRNSEFYEQENEIYASFEGENNSTIAIYFDLDLMEDLNSVEILSYVLNTIIYKLREFNADEEFNNLWSTEFGENNGFSPTEFIEMLKDDEDQFWDIASILERQYKEVKKALQWVEFYS